MIIAGTIGAIADFLRGRAWPSELIAHHKTGLWAGAEFDKIVEQYEIWDQCTTSKGVMSAVIALAVMSGVLLPWAGQWDAVLVLAAVGALVWNAFVWGWGAGLKAFGGDMSREDKDLFLDDIAIDSWNALFGNRYAKVNWWLPASGKKNHHSYLLDGEKPGSRHPKRDDILKVFGAWYMTVRSVLFLFPFLPLTMYHWWAPLIGLQFVFYGALAYLCGVVFGRYGEHTFTGVRGFLFTAGLYFGVHGCWG